MSCFIIFVNDLEKVTTNCRVQLICLRAGLIFRAGGIIQHRPILKINKDKCEVLHPIWTNPPQQYRMGTDRLRSISSEKDPGILVDCVTGTLHPPPPIKPGAFGTATTAFSRLILAPFVLCRAAGTHTPRQGEEEGRDPAVARQGPQPVRRLGSEKLLDRDQL
ncbi:hypothetical protein QYF61_018959 [Mycteria americana]|uniref:Uncharacterized protein n=1 Tax=Mycteria americana TaxID=33587 RepID=A0AAN7NVN6_MYCAM|nr:hypothetical protein QYF61_018959 [Mycteria americana]